MLFFSSILLIIFIFIEGTVTTVPLVLIMLLCLAIIHKGNWVFFLAFFAGLLLDLFKLQILGGTSLFYLIFLFLVLLYQRKYEINTFPFVIIASFIGSMLYLFIFRYDDVLLLAGISSVVAILLFSILKIRSDNSIQNSELGIQNYPSADGYKHSEF